MECSLKFAKPGKKLNIMNIQKCGDPVYPLYFSNHVMPVFRIRMNDARFANKSHL